MHQPLRTPAFPPTHGPSSAVLKVALPAAAVGALLHGTLWGGAPPAPVAAAEAAAAAGVALASATEVWKILEGFQG